MELVILDAATLGEDLDLSLFDTYGNVTVYPLSSPEEIKERVGKASVILINKVRITEEVLAAAPCLRLICIAATGYDNIDIAACRRHGVAVANVVGYSANSVSQLTVAMVLSLINRLPEYASYVASGNYRKGTVANRLTPVYHEIAGRTWGVFGYGAIGRRVADAARALGCRVLYTRNTPDGGEGCVDFDTLCRESDILTLHSPLNDATRGILSRERIAAMRDGAILVNVSRGAVTDEAAVAEAVLSGKLSGFGCDVYSREPYGEEHPFVKIEGHPAVCLTPHMAWGAHEARTRCLREMALNIEAFLRGEARSRVDL